MVSKQLTYDALKLLKFDTEKLQVIAGEMMFMQTLAKEGKIAQGIFTAKKELD